MNSINNNKKNNTNSKKAVIKPQYLSGLSTKTFVLLTALNKPQSQILKDHLELALLESIWVCPISMIPFILIILPILEPERPRAM